MGFSFDVYGDQRRDIRGRGTTDKILKNLQLLLDNEMSVGGIAVLSRSTIRHLANIFEFYNELGLHFRLLPYHLETNPEQTANNGVSPNDIAAAMCTLFDLWCQSQEPITIAPLREYTQDAITFINDQKRFYYDKEVDESIFIIDTDGGVYGHETYLSDHSYGNLFDQHFEEILSSQNRLRLVAKARERVERYCVKCKFFGACSGFPVADANPMEEEWISTSGCYVAKVIEHIVERLNKAGLGLLPDASQSVADPLKAVGV